MPLQALAADRSWEKAPCWSKLFWAKTRFKLFWAERRSSLETLCTVVIWYDSEGEIRGGEVRSEEAREEVRQERVIESDWDEERWSRDWDEVRQDKLLLVWYALCTVRRQSRTGKNRSMARADRSVGLVRLWGCWQVRYVVNWSRIRVIEDLAWTGTNCSR